MWSSCPCIAEPLSLHSRMKTRRLTRIVGVVTPLAVKRHGVLSANGSGTSAWSWDTTFSLILYAPPSLLRRCSPLHHTRLLLPALLPRRWAWPGKLAASQARTLLSSPMGRSGVLLNRQCSRMSNAEKPTGAYAWCMEPAFTVVVPVPCVSNASGMATLPQSRAR
jgi:hypothetical protein